MNKTGGSDGIPPELFQIPKDDAVKSYTQYASKFGKLSSGHRIEKGLNDLHNHDSVIMYLELDILEYEIKWALGSITINKS